MSFAESAEAFQKAESRAGDLLQGEDKLTLAILYRALGNAYAWRPSTIEGDLRTMRRELENKK